MGRGASDQWTGYDFEQLSIEIQARTGVLLSVTTLKRIWGKVKYTSLPAVSTLNTLSKFTGSKDWNGFKQDWNTQVEGMMVAPKKTAKRYDRKYNWFISATLFVVILLVLTVVLPKERRASGNYKFTSNKMLTSGLPNSVIFKYEVPLKGSDSVFITQSWDQSRKVAVSRTDHVLSSIYYEPGHYRAKLLVGERVVREHEILIESGGWLALAEADNKTPVYFKKGDILKDSLIILDDRLMGKYGLNKQRKIPTFKIFNVQDLKGLSSSDFTLETRFKVTTSSLATACPLVEIGLMGRGSILSIPLTLKGCVGDLSMYAWDTVVSSKTADLSAFGCLSDFWIDLKVRAKDGRTTVFINGNPAYSFKNPVQPVSIVGINYNCNGPVYFGETRLAGNNLVVNF